MNYRIEIPGVQPFTIPINQFEQLCEAMQRFLAGGYRDGETRWRGIVITECGDARKPTGVTGKENSNG